MPAHPAQPIFTSVCLAADHGGFEIQEELFSWLSDSGVVVHHLGPRRMDKDDDYPPYAQAVAGSVQNHERRVGVLVCRSGAGMTIVANRFPGVRAVVCRTQEDARLAREHNDANVLVLEGDHVSPEAARELFLTFVGTPFAGGRHERRLQQFE